MSSTWILPQIIMRCGLMKSGNQCMLMMVVDLSSPYYIDYGYLVAWYFISYFRPNGNLTLLLGSPLPLTWLDGGSRSLWVIFVLPRIITPLQEFLVRPLLNCFCLPDHFYDYVWRQQLYSDVLVVLCNMVFCSIVLVILLTWFLVDFCSWHSWSWSQ